MMKGELIQRVWEGLGADSSDFGSGRVEDELQRVYRFTIPNLVGGPAFTGPYSHTVNAGSDQDDFSIGVIRNFAEPFWRISPRRRILYYTSEDAFWSRYEWSTSGRHGTIEAALVLGRSIYFRPIPTADTNLMLTAVQYRGLFGDQGIENDDEARLVIALAVASIASDNDMEDVAGRNAAIFDEMKGVVFAMYKGGPRHYVPEYSGYEGNSGGYGASGRYGRY